MAGSIFGTIVDNGGLQYVFRADGSYGATHGTIIRNGGLQLVSQRDAIGSVISHGGVEDVYMSAENTVIRGGTMIIEADGEQFVRGGIHFTARHGVLELRGPSVTDTTISGFAS